MVKIRKSELAGDTSSLSMMHNGPGGKCKNYSQAVQSQKGCRSREKMKCLAQSDFQDKLTRSSIFDLHGKGEVERGPFCM